MWKLQNLTAGPSVQKHQAHFPTDNASLRLSPCCPALTSLVKEAKTISSSLYCSLILSLLKNLCLSLIYSQSVHMRILHCIPFNCRIPLIKGALQQRPPEFPLSIQQGGEDYSMLKKYWEVLHWLHSQRSEFKTLQYFLSIFPHPVN